MESIHKLLTQYKYSSQTSTFIYYISLMQKMENEPHTECNKKIKRSKTYKVLQKLQQ